MLIYILHTPYCVLYSRHFKPYYTERVYAREQNVMQFITLKKHEQINNPMEIRDNLITMTPEVPVRINAFAAHSAPDEGMCLLNIMGPTAEEAPAAVSYQKKVSCCLTIHHWLSKDHGLCSWISAGLISGSVLGCEEAQSKVVGLVVFLSLYTPEFILRSDSFQSGSLSMISACFIPETYYANIHTNWEWCVFIDKNNKVRIVWAIDVDTTRKKREKT